MGGGVKRGLRIYETSLARSTTLITITQFQKNPWTQGTTAKIEKSAVAAPANFNVSVDAATPQGSRGEAKLTVDDSNLNDQGRLLPTPMREGMIAEGGGGDKLGGVTSTPSVMSRFFSPLTRKQPVRRNTSPSKNFVPNPQ